VSTALSTVKKIKKNTATAAITAPFTVALVVTQEVGDSAAEHFFC
jgi:hypothetical protein